MENIDKVLLKMLMTAQMQKFVELCKQRDDDTDRKLNAKSVEKMADAALNVLYAELKD